MDGGSKPIVFRGLFGAGADLSNLDWKPFREGVEIVRIYGDGKTGSSAAFLRYAPGASLPYHEHVAYEHILILSQSQSDEAGRNAAGTLIVNPPGYGHTVHSDEGTIVLAIWEKPVVFPLEAESDQAGAC